MVCPPLKALFEITFHGSLFFKIAVLCISKHFVDISQWVNQVQKSRSWLSTPVNLSVYFSCIFNPLKTLIGTKELAGFRPIPAKRHSGCQSQYPN